MKTILKLALLILICSTCAHAQCSGSGITWTVNPGTTHSQMATCIASSTDGATFTFQPGTYSVGSLGGGAFYQFSQAKGSTFICATAPGTVGAATVNPCLMSGAGPAMGTDTFSGTNTFTYRISGFTFDLGGSASGLGTLYFDTYNGSAPGVVAYVKNLRVDHNTFQNGSNGAQTTLIGSGGQLIQVYGVYDHNLYQNATQFAALIWAENANPSPPASQLGTANNLFFEDNTLNFASVGNASAEGCTDGWGGSAYVVRHNTATDCLWAAHGVTHGGGPANYEFYNNTTTMDAGSVAAGTSDCYRSWHHQGSGEAVIFNNLFTCYTLPANSEIISMLYYRDYPNGIDGTMPADAAQCNGTVNGPADDPIVVDGNRSPNGSNFGYRCWRQPGTDIATQNLMPVYSWNNNLTSGTTPDTGTAQILLENFDQGGSPDYWAYHFNPNRDYFNAVGNAQSSATTPFNGTTGMGYGTIANRPTTCTPNPNAADAGFGGVGYFATDVGAQGTLYHCSGTNTWSVFYVPYQYPYPYGPTPPPPTPAPQPNPPSVLFPMIAGTATGDHTTCAPCATGQACLCKASDGSWLAVNGSLYAQMAAQGVPGPAGPSGASGAPGATGPMGPQGTAGTGGAVQSVNGKTGKVIIAATSTTTTTLK